MPSNQGQLSRTSNPETRHSDTSNLSSPYPGLFSIKTFGGLKFYNGSGTPVLSLNPEAISLNTEEPAIVAVSSFLAIYENQQTQTFFLVNRMGDPVFQMSTHGIHGLRLTGHFLSYFHEEIEGEEDSSSFHVVNSLGQEILASTENEQDLEIKETFLKYVDPRTNRLQVLDVNGRNLLDLQLPRFDRGEDGNYLDPQFVAGSRYFAYVEDTLGPDGQRLIVRTANGRTENAQTANEELFQQSQLGEIAAASTRLIAYIENSTGSNLIHVRNDEGVEVFQRAQNEIENLDVQGGFFKYSSQGIEHYHASNGREIFNSTTLVPSPHNQVFSDHFLMVVNQLNQLKIYNSEGLELINRSALEIRSSVRSDLDFRREYQALEVEISESFFGYFESVYPFAFRIFNTAGQEVFHSDRLILEFKL